MNKQATIETIDRAATWIATHLDTDDTVIRVEVWAGTIRILVPPDTFDRIAGNTEVKATRSDGFTHLSMDIDGVTIAAIVLPPGVGQ